MILLIALPVFATVALVHRCRQLYAPSNLLVRHVRIAAPRVRNAIGLFALATALFIAMHMVAKAVADGAPGWLNLLVLLLAWDAIKIALLTVAECVRAFGAGLRHRLVAARGPAPGTS